MSDWIWSDLHLGHDAIIGYESRPFLSIDDMNEKLLDAWRSTVDKNDRIWNLGDVALGLNKDALTRLIKSMPGRKILVLGNHDRDRSIGWWRDVGFDEVYPYPIIFDDFFMLSHEPLYVNKMMPYVNVHGHTHGTSSDNPQQVNVSVDVTGFKPLALSDIVARFARKRDAS
jgi:calcineurin-like phosphoesterase family protein